MKVSETIKKKMRRMAALSSEVSRLSAEVEDYFTKKGFDVEKLRDGDGRSLEELEYGNNVTEEFCEKIESGYYAK